MFDNPTNRNRVKLIGETLDKLEKSASSNRATPDEVAEMLSPVLDRFAKIKNSGDQMRPQSEIVSEAAMQPIGHLRQCQFTHMADRITGQQSRSALRTRRSKT